MRLNASLNIERPKASWKLYISSSCIASFNSRKKLERLYRWWCCIENRLPGSHWSPIGRCSPINPSGQRPWKNAFMAFSLERGQTLPSPLPSLVAYIYIYICIYKYNSRRTLISRWFFILDGRSAGWPPQAHHCWLENRGKGWGRGGLEQSMVCACRWCTMYTPCTRTNVVLERVQV